MIARLTSVLKRLGRIVARVLFVLSVTLAVLWLGGMLILNYLPQLFPRAVEEEAPPLGGEPVRVVMGELKLDIPRISIVRITPTDGDTLDLSEADDRRALVELEMAAEGERIPIRGVGFIFYSAFGGRCRLPEQLEFLCEYGRQGERPFLLTFDIGRFNPDRSDRMQARARDFENAAQAGIIDYSEIFSVARRGDGGFVFRGRDDHDLVISCPAPICFQNGEVEKEYNYTIRYSIDVNNSNDIKSMAYIHTKIFSSLLLNSNSMEERGRL